MELVLNTYTHIVTMMNTIIMKTVPLQSSLTMELITHTTLPLVTMVLHLAACIMDLVLLLKWLLLVLLAILISSHTS